jgi:hypothetical protein
VASKKKKIIKMLKKINNKDFDDNKRYISLNKVKSEYNESIKKIIVIVLIIIIMMEKMKDHSRRFLLSITLIN